jgi:hypothetical protein
MWARAFWQATHKKGATGRGSITFNTFPAEIAEAVKNAAELTPEKVSIVGLQYHDYKGDLNRFDGAQPVNVRFELQPHGAHLPRPQGPVKPGCYSPSNRYAFLASR